MSQPIHIADSPKEYLEGDSNYTLPPDKRTFYIGVAGVNHTVEAHHNSNNRMASWEIAPFEAPNSVAALIASINLFNSLTAWLSAYNDVPIRQDGILIRRDRGKESAIVLRIPYPIVNLDDVVMRPYPIAWPLASLYADGVRSNSPFYTFLCFLKLADLILRAFPMVMKSLSKKHNIQLDELNGTLPEIPFKYLAAVDVGRKFTSLRDKYRDEYRDDIAHFNLRIGLGPFVWFTEEGVVRASHVMRYVAKELLTIFFRNLNKLQDNEVLYPTYGASLEHAWARAEAPRAR